MSKYLGSSPRVRGTYGRARGHHPVVRFIPACAGNISLRIALAELASVHPRVCGEHHLLPCARRWTTGSSPRVRGTCEQGQIFAFNRRFIPACAGNIDPSICTGAYRPVHPRVCGEHMARILCTDIAIGSSPRVRGTLVIPAPDHQLIRFIPACAGNIAQNWPHSRARSVHPRVCGEHVGQGKIVVVGFGSSPRVRGTYPHNSGPTRLQRFIPACAGNMTWYW